MTRGDFINFLNQQTDTLQLSKAGKLTPENVEQISFDDLTGDSLEALQLVMAIEERIGIDIEITDLRNCRSLLDAIDLMISRIK